jgi:hypothetical protein
MRLKISKSQFQLLTNNFVIVENRLHQRDTNLIFESMREYKVRILFNGWQSEIRIGASSSGSAIAIAKIMFPKALVTGLTKLV